MALLSGNTGTYGTRVPIRVERLSGSVAALTTTHADGSWEVDVAPGDYMVIERYGSVYRATVTGSDSTSSTGSTVDEFPPGSPGASRRARARREGAS